MMPIFVSLSLVAATMAVPANQTTAPAGAPTAAKTRIQELIEAAPSDPAAVVPLILEGSARLVALPTVEARALGDELQPFCARAFFGPERLPGMKRLGLGLHVVAKGEIPVRIAQRYGIGVGMLSMLNAGFDERKLQVGQKLKVLDARSKLRITVARGQYRLGAWLDVGAGAHALVMFVPVGVGASGSPTPLGRTKVVNRVLGPEWTDPDTGRVFGASDAGNVLGGYWIALDGAGLGRSGIGLHGYTGAPEEDWIQKGGSHGCVRMLQVDVDRVFHLAVEGTPVTIVE